MKSSPDDFSRQTNHPPSPIRRTPVWKQMMPKRLSVVFRCFVLVATARIVNSEWKYISEKNIEGQWRPDDIESPQRGDELYFSVHKTERLITCFVCLHSSSPMLRPARTCWVVERAISKQVSTFWTNRRHLSRSPRTSAVEDFPDFLVEEIEGAIQQHLPYSWRHQNFEMQSSVNH